MSSEPSVRDRDAGNAAVRRRRRRGSAVCQRTLVQTSSVGASVQDLSAADGIRWARPPAEAGLSFEQTLGAMELLANRGIRGRKRSAG